MLRSHDYKHNNVMHNFSVRPLYSSVFVCCIHQVVHATETLSVNPLNGLNVQNMKQSSFYYPQYVKDITSS